MQVTELGSTEALSIPRTNGLVSHEWTGAQRDAPWISPDLRQSLLTALPLAAADLLAVLSSLTFAWRIATVLWPAATLDWAPLAAGFISAFFVANVALGLYPGSGLGPVSEVRLTSLAVAYVGPVFLAVSLMENGLSLAIQLVIVVTCGLLLLILPLARALARAVFSRCSWWGQPALIIGDDPAELIHSLLGRNPRLGLRSVGIVGDWHVNNRCDVAPHHLGPLSRAAAVARDVGAPWLIVAMPRQEEAQVVIRRLAGQRWRLTVITDLGGSPSLWNRAGGCLGWPGRYPQAYSTPLLRFVERAIDVSATIVGGLLLSPLVIAIAVLIKLGSPGPVFYRQQRVGLRGRRFMVWKFRTMICDGDRVLREYLAACPVRLAQWDRDHKLPDDPRVTPIGRWLRKTSLDELPQLWNVLLGEMSLVGPRPILPTEIADFGSSFETFCSVLPGLTGLWQVCGRNNTTYAEHIELDCYYAQNWSLWLDLYILASTIKVVLLRDGAY